MPGKTARSNPQTPFGRPGMATAGRTSHLGFQPVQKAPIFVASSGFIGGIPVNLAAAPPAWRIHCQPGRIQCIVVAFSVP